MSKTSLAIDGGPPVRASLLPYGRHLLDERDVEAVTRALRDPYLTRGPGVAAFEQVLANAAGSQDAVAFTSGTAALDAAAYAAGVSPQTEAVVPAITFAATANGPRYHGATVAVADIHPDTWNLDPADAALGNTPQVILPVDFAGLPIDVSGIASRAPDALLIEDAAHALGAIRDGTPVGSCRTVAMTCFSFHPVKVLTTLEGGAVTTNDPELAARLRSFRDHGMERRPERMSRVDGPWHFEQQSLGRNYHMSDVQARLGIAQLGRLEERVIARNQHAAWYRENIPTDLLELPPAASPGDRHGYHIFPVLLRTERLSANRRRIFEALRAEGIGVQVHYLPIHHHPYHATTLRDADPARFPVAEDYYSRCLTLPLFPDMTASDRQDVADALAKVLDAYQRTPE